MALMTRTLFHAAPFWMSLTVPVLVWIGAIWGGVWVLAALIWVWYVFIFIDLMIGAETANSDPETPVGDIFWHRAITLIWPPAQAVTLFGVLWYTTRASHLGTFELIGLFASVGIMSGAIGIVYAHELMHQPSRLERWLGDLQMTMVLYGHYRSEHLLVHHVHVATPRDTVSARYGEGFHRFFWRVLPGSFWSAIEAEAAKLARKNLSPWHKSNPFWRYAGLQMMWLALAVLIGGGLGVLLFAFQAIVAIFQLELINYIEHYGLTRQKLPNGKYEPVRPHHSWDVSRWASNRLLINVQRHSDHHAKPSRRFPLLQAGTAETGPLLPYGYQTMTLIALVPPLWRRIMHPRIKDWRARFYPT